MKYKSTPEEVEEVGFVCDLRFDMAREFLSSLLTNSAITPETAPILALKLADEFLSESENLGYIKQG